MWEIIRTDTNSPDVRTIGDLTITLFPDSPGMRLSLLRNGDTSVSLVHGINTDRIQLLPVVPDRPLMIIPDVPIMLLPDAEYAGSFRMPVWIRFLTSTGRSEENTIDEYPSVLLKKTWSGSPESGEPAYRLYHVTDDTTGIDTHTCLVPFQIRNSSGTNLLVEHLLVRVVHLDMFSFGDKLQTNAVSFDFRGKDQESRISFQRSHIVEREGGVKISTARVSVSNDIIKKSFYWIRDLAV